jgi:hypothetical protein
MDDAAAVIASVLDKDTVMSLLQSRLKESEGEGHREVLDKDDN